jgi:site-specific DNA-cytosine methylase
MNTWGSNALKREYTVAHLFGGIGGGSLGFNGARGEYMGGVGRFRTLCSVDADPVACRNYEAITGGKAVCMDLFSKQQYRDFHGKEPSSDWCEASPGDLWDAFGGEVPDVIFTSPPCKGFSGLLPEKSAKTKKYQALNLLTIRGIELTLAACREYGGELPTLFLLENVPRIMTRGKKILDRIKQVLRAAGYAVSDNTHDCGELGGLGQRRKRYLLIARNEQKMPNFVYQPAKKPLKTIGDVIGPLPFPGDTAAAGPLHKLPNLEWKTWLRLALIPAGGDWRDLNNLDWQNYRIEHEPRRGAWAVEDWNETAGTVTGGAGPGRSNGVSAVSDPRLQLNEDNTHRSIYRMSQWDETSQTITGAVGPNNGAVCIDDPRLQERDGRHPGVYRVVRFNEPAPCVTGTRFGSGALAISDPRCKTELHPDSYGVQYWDDTAKSVRSANRIMQSAASIADPRLNDRGGQRRSNGYPVRNWNEQAFTITGEDSLGSGGQSIQDPRLGCAPRSGSYGVMAWDETATTVTGSGDVHSGAAAVADPRIPADNDRGVYLIIAQDGTWHRPLTTFELAMLQGFPVRLPNGKPFQLVGSSDAKAREYIGNAVPPDAGKAMGTVMLVALMAAQAGETFSLSFDAVWVREGEQRAPVQMVH